MSLIGPNYVLESPTQFAHDYDVTPDGVYGQTTGPGISPPGGLGSDMPGGPQFNGHYVRGKTNTYTKLTDFKITDYPFAQKVANWVPGDTTAGLPIFLKTGPPIVGQQHNRRSYEAWGISQLNRMLKHEPQMRFKYGKLKSARELRKDYAFMGIQQAKQTQLYDKLVWNEINNVIVQGRARIPDLALSAAGGPPVTEGCVLWLVWRRYCYAGDEGLDVNSWDQPDRTAPEDDQYMTDPSLTMMPLSRKRRADFEPDDEERRRYIKTTANAGGNIDFSKMEIPNPFAAGQPAVNVKESIDRVMESMGQKPEPGQEYYWQVEVLSIADGQRPHPMMYQGDVRSHNQFFGEYRRLGFVHKVAKGYNSRTADQVMLARKALYPSVRGIEYMTPLRQLDEVTIQVCEG